jgi:hypothetical protein
MLEVFAKSNETTELYTIKITKYPFVVISIASRHRYRLVTLKSIHALDRYLYLPCIVYSAEITKPELKIISIFNNKY